MIAITGTTGGIGAAMPLGRTVALKTRLEEPIEKMVVELKAIKPRVLIHLAGLVSVSDCEKDPARAHELNVNGSLKWFEAAARAGVKRFIFVSTSHVYAPSEPGKPLNVHSPLGPQAVYGQTKLEAENELKKAASRAGTPDLVIARVFSVLSKHGRSWTLLKGLEKRAQEKDFSPIPGLSNKRDFLWAEEVCARLLKLADMHMPPAIALLCSGKATTIREVAEKVFKEHGLDPSLIQDAGGAGVAEIVGVPTSLVASKG